MAKAEAAQEGARSDVEELALALKEPLEQLQKNLRGILGSVIVGADGSPLIWDLRGGVEPMLVATAGALMGRSGDRIADRLDLGAMKSHVLTTEQGSLAVFRITEDAFLVTLLQPTANSILVVVEVGKALEKLREVMGPG